MIRVVSLILAAILCHSPAALATEPAPAPELDHATLVQHLKFAIFVLQTAQHRKAIRRCLSPRCLEQSKTKAVGWAALYLVGVNVLRRYVSPRYFASSMASYATKTAARLGLVSVGVSEAQAVLAVAVAYEATIGLVQPAYAPGVAESILNNQEYLDRLLAMNHRRVLMIALNDRLLADELVVMAHNTILATFPEFQVVWKKFYLPPAPAPVAPRTPWLSEYPMLPTP